MKSNNKIILVIIMLIVAVMFVSKTNFLGSTLKPNLNNFKLAACIYSPSSLSASDAEWINNNLDIAIVHEYLLDDLAGKTPQTKVLMYKTSTWNSDTDTVSVAGYNEYEAQHEDWFVHSASNQRLMDPNTPHKAYWMNYKAQGWIDYSINDINLDLAANTYSNGLFYDAMQIQRGEMDGPKEYANDNELKTAAFALISKLTQGVSKEVWVNGAPYTTGYEGWTGGIEGVGKSFFNSADGFFDENLGMNWKGQWISNEVIFSQLNMMDYAEQQKKPMIVNALFKYTPSSNHDDLVMLYMMGSNQYTYFSYNYEGYNFGGAKNWYASNQNLINNIRKLGLPTGKRVLNGDILSRNFANGKISFNLINHVGTITINDQAYDPFNQPNDEDTINRILPDYLTPGETFTVKYQTISSSSFGTTIEDNIIGDCSPNIIKLVGINQNELTATITAPLSGSCTFSGVGFINTGTTKEIILPSVVLYPYSKCGKGDQNGDGIISITEINYFINMYLLNGDIMVSDLNEIINKYLTGC